MKGASHIAPLGVRLPEELKQKLQERAVRNGRSMNSEIVQILEDALKARVVSWDKSLAPESSEDVVTMSMSQLNKIVSIAAEDTAKSVVESLAEKYELTPRRNKKPT